MPTQDPTPQEQYWLNIYNEARVARGLQPVAWDPVLGATAQAHNEWMLQNDVFQHSTDLSGDVFRAGWDLQDGDSDGLFEWSIMENHGWGHPTPSQATADGQEALADQQLAGYMSSPSHYAAMFDPNVEEVGLDIQVGNFGKPPYESIGAHVSTMHMGASEEAAILLGDVQYNVTGTGDGDGKYDVGEGLAGVTVTATNTATGQVYTTATNSAGGYRLDLGDGNFNVKVGNTTKNVTMSGLNQELDFFDPTFGPVDTTGPGATLYGTKASENFWGTGGDDTFFTGVNGKKFGNTVVDTIYTSNAPNQPGGDDIIYDFGDFGTDQDFLWVPTVDFANLADFLDDRAIVGNDLVVTSDLNDSTIIFKNGASLYSTITDDVGFYF